MERGDRLRLLLVCPAERLDEVAGFYTDVLGFELESSLDGIRGLRDGPTRVLLGAPGALDLVPEGATRDAVLILATPDAAGSRRGLVSRYAGPVGPLLRPTPQAVCFELTDPLGNRVWYMELAP